MDLTAEGHALTAAVTGGLLPQSVEWHVGRLRLHCLLWGRREDPPLLLIHGNGGHAHWWDPLISAFVPGWRVLAPDLRGHGESDWPEPAAYRLGDFSDDVIGLLDALGAAPDRSQPTSVALIGHSMGGRVATWLAAQHPQRVRALALLDTRLGGIKPEVAQQYRGRVAGQRQGRSYATRAEALAAFRFVPEERDVASPIVADLAHHAVCERQPDEWTFRFDRAVLSLDGDGGGDLLPLLGRVRCPLSIMNGEHSWVMDAPEVAAIRSAAPRCEIRTFPGGHHFLVAHPQVVGPVLRAFLDPTVG